MNLYYRFLVLLMTGISFSVNAQTFTVSPSRFIETTYDVNDYGGGNIWVKNNSATTITLGFQTLKNTMTPKGWSARLCTQINCAPYVLPSGSFGSVASGDSSYIDLGVGFNGIAGIGEIQFRVYEPSNPSNTDTVNIKYTAKTSAITGILETGSNSFDLSQNYPNPFINFTTIKYHLEEANGKIIVTDISGKNVEEYSLSAKSGTLRIGENLKSGIYFYSLHSSNKIIARHKMIVQ